MEVSFNNAINDTFDKDADFQLGLQEEHDHEQLQDHQEQEEIEREPDSGRQIPAAGPSRYPVGSLVWAKLPGYSFWPAVVTLPDMTIASNRQKIESGIIHIHFFGYDDDVSFNFVYLNLTLNQLIASVQLLRCLNKLKCCTNS